MKRKNEELQKSQKKANDIKMAKRLKMMSLDGDVSHDKELQMLKEEVQAENQDLNNIIEIFRTLPSVKDFGDGYKQSPEVIQKIMDLLRKHISVGNINIEYLLGKGRMKLARDPTKQFALVPFETNMFEKEYRRRYFINICSGQLNATKNEIVEGGIGRVIQLVLYKDKATGQIISFDEGYTYIKEGQLLSEIHMLNGFCK